MNTEFLPLYTAEQSRQLDALCIADENISGFQLMQRAGEAAFRLMMRRWPGLKTITIVCGIGNNGGDGYVIAKLAAQQGLVVEVIQLGDVSRQSGDARLALQSMQAVGLQTIPFQHQQLFNGEVLVDVIFGTGLVREVEGIWKTAIETINAASSPVLAIDIPSGVHADTGAVLGCAIQADVTVTFIAHKQGLYTADARQQCGDIYFENLEVAESVYNKVVPSAYGVTQLLDVLTQKRPANSHKKMFGHVLVIGGASGMRGAAQLAAHAALRSGAGLVSVATHPNHADYFNLTLPELMVHGVNEDRQLLKLMDNADVIVVGPGLGQTSWAKDMLACAVSSDQLLVIDADALNLLAAQKQQSDHWILTPHPGEAAKLLRIEAITLNVIASMRRRKLVRFMAECAC